MSRAQSLYMRMLCTALFCTFSLVYLYSYQSDILFRLQHAASNGKTHYVPVVGAILITIVMKLLQTLVYGITKLYKRYHALTYVPSSLFLAFLTSLKVDANNNIVFGAWWWAGPLAIVCFLVIVWVAQDNQRVELTFRSYGISSQLMWVNIMQLAIMFFVVILVGCHDRDTHVKAHAQRIIYNNVRQFNDYRKMLAEKTESEESSKKKKNDETVKENVDSVLCDMLMRKDLKGFAKKVKGSYDLAKPIPGVYAEALQIYMRQPNPRYHWSNHELSMRLDRFYAACRNEEATKNRNAFMKHFGDSYWFYYTNK